MPSGYLKTLDGTRIEIVDAKAREDIETLNSGKVDAETGKSLSTNDYDNAAKAKVDAIPSNPKYTDTVYDDTDVKADLNSCVKFVTQSLTDAQKAQVKTNIDATRITKTWITRSWTLSTFNTYATFGRSESWTAPTSGIVVGDIFTIKVDINDCSNLRGYILVQVTDIKYDVSSLVGTTLFACTQYAEKETLTESEKTSARSRLGAASSSDVEAISSNYISVDDESDVETVPEDVHDVRVNGTSIVENGVANLKEASGDDYGVVKLNSAYGISVYNHFLSTNPAVNSIIDAKTNSNRPITPYYLDYAVKSGLADSKIEWTDADKKSACERIGALTNKWKDVFTFTTDSSLSANENIIISFLNMDYDEMIIVIEKGENASGSNNYLKFGDATKFFSTAIPFYYDASMSISYLILNRVSSNLCSFVSFSTSNGYNVYTKVGKGSFDLSSVYKINFISNGTGAHIGNGTIISIYRR